MTTEQQRIKIASACGWVFDHIRNGAMYYIAEKDFHVGDPLRDLNAMHEAEIDYIMPNGLWDDYVTHLRNLMKDGERFWGQATAKQRAEAFLRTLNLWGK
jgi:hypothetical protein